MIYTLVVDSTEIITTPDTKEIVRQFQRELEYNKLHKAERKINVITRRISK